MAFAFTQAVGVGASTSSTTLGQAYTGNVTVGGLLVAACEWNSSSLTCSVADSRNGTWTPIASALASDATHGWRTQLFCFPNAAAGATTVTMTTSGTTTERLLDILEYSGGPTSSPVDISNNALATDPPTVTIVTVNDHDLIVAHALASNSTNDAAPFTGRLATNGNATIDLIDKTPAGSQACTFGANGNAWSLAVAAGFSLTPVGGGGTTIVSPVQLLGPSYAAQRAASI